MTDVSIVSNDGVKSTTKVLRKFNFLQKQLAMQVRQTVLQMLINFDRIGDGLFDKDEISSALATIMEETQEEIQYVTLNVFRYDVNGDGKVTYDELTNFCVEQHFGEMAIQRLHKRGVYQKGKKRIMTCNQFLQTITYALHFIYLTPTQQEINLIFSQIDLDNDNYITYQDYFCFLREYFGSKSQAAIKLKPEQIVIQRKKYLELEGSDAGVFELFHSTRHKIIKMQPKKLQASTKFKKSSLNTQQMTKQEYRKKLYSHIGKLILSQTRLITLSYDIEHNLNMDEQKINSILENTIKLSSDHIDRIKRILISQQEQNCNYKYFVKELLKYLATEVPIGMFNMGLDQEINLKTFIKVINECLHFIKIKPSPHIISDLYEPHYTLRETYNMLGEIILKYTF